MLDRLLKLIADYPRTILLAVVAVSLAATAGLYDFSRMESRLGVDPSVTRLLPESDEDNQFYQQIRKLFGSEDVVIVGVATDDVLTSDNIARLSGMSEGLARLPGVYRAVSIANVPNPRTDADSVDVGTVADQLAADPGSAAQVRAEVLANPLYRGNLVSDDARVAAIVVYLKDVSDQQFLDSGLQYQIADVVEAHRGEADIWMTGTPIIKAATTKALLRQLGFMIPALGLLAAAFLAIVFRHPAAVILPLLNISLALLWTLGTLGWLDRPLNLVTVIVPPLIITLGLAYSMHVMSECYTQLASPDHPDRQRVTVRQILSGVALPLTITGVTTTAGFLALLLSPLLATREFALVSAGGVLYATILSLTFLPVTLSLFGPRKGARLPAGAAFFHRIAGQLARFDIGYRRWIIVASGVLAALAVAGTWRIHTGTDFIKDFRPHALVRQQYEAISEAFGGANTFFIVIDGHGPDAIADPEALAAIGSLQQWLETQPEIADSTSVADHLLLLHQSFSGEPQSELPADRKLIKQLLVFGGGEELESLIDRRFSIANISVRSNVDETAAIADLARRIKTHLETLPPPLTGKITGHSVLIARTVDDIAEGQMGSIMLAMLAIFLIMAALFTSWRAAAIAIFPNLLPIVIYFGALGLLGISLNPTTSLIACIALGIAADDTIHYFVRFNTDAKRTASEVKATASALGEVLRPITYTTAALCLGFLMLTTSELRNQVDFGLLAAFTLVVAWLANITLTPALASGVRIVTLWDVVRLDLGQDPHLSIPLMRDLNLRHARTFALLSDIIDLPAGARLLTEGDEGEDMYLVIDGQLRVWVERNDGPVELATMKRGDVLGEIGHFVHKRTANVDAMTRVRLLSFNDKSLERLRRWRPWIAAVVYRNLNRAQAERLARATHMMR